MLAATGLASIGLASIGSLELGGLVAGTPGSVRYDVLGPLRAWQDDTELDLGPAKQRAVLAVLLLHANRPVPTTTIIDAVWRDDPPANGVNVVQKHVAGLRRVLEPGRSARSGGGVITLTDAGYVLSVAPGALDSDAVDDLMTRARAERAGGRLSAASALLSDAIGRWRADALAGLSGAAFDAARVRLAETRAGVIEAWVDVELDLGHHETVGPALGTYVVQFPVRERLRAQLMLALYRCGRQAEALEAYRDAHRFLDREFGVAPGEALTRLHQQILRGDPQLMRPEPELPPAAAPPPASPPPVAATSAMTTGYWPPPVALATPPEPRLILRVVEWIAICVGVLISICTIGFATWLVVGIVAVRYRSAMLGWSAAGYGATAVGMFVLVGVTPDNSSWSDVAILVSFLAGLAGAAQISFVTALRSRHRAAARQSAPQPDQAFHMHQHVRREHARQIMAQYPEFARQLNIGRPDLPRTFDDGGLVDVNAVPEYVLVMMLGFDPRHAHQVAIDRDQRGPFGSASDLVSRGLLDPVSFYRLGDLMIAGPVETKVEQSESTPTR
jgi:SARP family transcriptional regulator, regulator of embCAB operon